jgi:hypothetical protein
MEHIVTVFNDRLVCVSNWRGLGVLGWVDCCTLRHVRVSFHATMCSADATNSAVIVLVLYVVGGTLYNRFVLHKHGFDQFPRISLFSFTDTLDAVSGLCDRLLGSRAQAWHADRRAYQRVSHHDEEQSLARHADDHDEEDEDALEARGVRSSPPEGGPSSGIDANGVIRL